MPTMPVSGLTSGLCPRALFGRYSTSPANASAVDTTSGQTRSSRCRRANETFLIKGTSKAQVLYFGSQTQGSSGRSKSSNCFHTSNLETKTIMVLAVLRLVRMPEYFLIRLIISVRMIS